MEVVKVATTDGHLVALTPVGKQEPLTLEQAEADAAARNRRAEALGIETRYQAEEV